MVYVGSTHNPADGKAVVGRFFYITAFFLLIYYWFEVPEILALYGLFVLLDPYRGRVPNFCIKLVQEVSILLLLISSMLPTGFYLYVSPRFFVFLTVWLVVLQRLYQVVILPKIEAEFRLETEALHSL